MASRYVIRCRLVVLLFTLLTLGAAALSSANMRFAVVLRDRARAGYVDNNEVILDKNFQTLQVNILIASVIGAIPAALFGLFGIVMAVHPKLLPDCDGSIPVFVILQLIVALALVVSGGYNADHAQGFQTSFAKFAGNDHIPYYSIIYFGSVAQAGYGAILIVTTVMTGLDQYRMKKARAEATAGKRREVQAEADEQAPPDYDSEGWGTRRLTPGAKTGDWAFV
jgi:hypothetical protein